MKKDLKPYPAYKDSGLPWVGAIPEHWNLVPNRAYLKIRKILVGKKHTQYQLLSLTKNGVIVRDLVGLKGKFSSDMGTSQEVRVGDLIFCLFDVPETPRTVGLSGFEGMITGAYTVMECPDNHVAQYFELFYKAMDDRKLLSPLYSGLRNTIQKERFLGTKTPLPPPSEQALIIRFLDWTNERLDQVIQAKRKIINLLNERKQVIIHRAVTCGLEVNVHFKDSGISWLGEIPEHWEVKRIKYLLQEVDERSVTGSEPLLSLRMHHGIVLFSDHFSRPPQAATLVGFKIVHPGQLVINRMQAGNGLIFASTLFGLVSPDYAVFKPIGDTNIDYLGELFRSPKVRTKFRIESTGLGTGSSGFLRLYNECLGAIHVALPPRDEQDKIVKKINDRFSQLNKTISINEKKIDLISQYRIRLTNDIVTGKLDVSKITSYYFDGTSQNSNLNISSFSDDSEEESEETIT